MDVVAQHETGPMVSLELAVAVAKQHTWIRVGFTIGVIAYAMAVIVAAREMGFPDWLTAVLYVGGSAAIGAWGIRWHRGAKRTMASASVIDAGGSVVGRADRVLKRELERKLRPWWAAQIAFWFVAVPVGVLTPGAQLPGWGVTLALVVATLAWQRTRTVERRKASGPAS